jgi:hypothetical protein
MNALWTVLAAIVGALLYGFAPGKAGELGRLLFVAACAAFLFAVSGRSVHLF